MKEIKSKRELGKVYKQGELDSETEEEQEKNSTRVTEREIEWQ